MFDDISSFFSSLPSTVQNLWNGAGSSGGVGGLAGTLGGAAQNGASGLGQC